MMENNIKIMDYNELTNEYLDNFKSYNQLEYFINYETFLKNYNTNKLKELIYNHEIFLFEEAGKNNNLLIVKIPSSNYRTSCYEILLANINNITFLYNALDILFKKFYFFKWKKVKLILLRYQLENNENLKNFIKNIGFQNEVILKSSYRHLDQLVFVYFNEVKYE